MRDLSGSHAGFKTRMRIFWNWLIYRMRKKFTACDKNLFFTCGKTRFACEPKINENQGKSHAEKIWFVRKMKNACERKKPAKTWKSHAEKRTSHVKKNIRTACVTKELDLVTKNPHVNNSIPHATFSNHMWKLKPTSKYKNSHMRF